MLKDRNSKEHIHTFGFYLAWLVIILILLGAAIILIPVWKDYRTKQKELLQLRTELDRMKLERNQKHGEVSALATSPDAVEKVARERYNLVRPGETVLVYKEPESAKK